MLIKLLGLFFFMCFFIPQLGSAEELCNEQEAEELKVCVEDCQLACQEQYPACKKQPFSLEDLRAAIAERCDCEQARNFGRYRSCVAQLMNSLRRFNLIDDEIMAAIAEDNRECRAAIQRRRRAKNPGGGPPDGLPRGPKS